MSAPEAIHLHTFDDAQRFLPEEVKARLEIATRKQRNALKALLRGGVSEENPRVRNIRDSLEQFKARLVELGGDTREQTMRVLNEYDPERDSIWYVQGFSDIERRYFETRIATLCERFGSKVQDLHMDDRGMGTGRSLRMLLELVKEKYSVRAAKALARNIGGNDLMARHVEKAWAALASYGVPRENLRKENYLTSPRRASPRRASPRRGKRGPAKKHLITFNMHSSFHCVTEKDWAKLLKRAADDLALPPDGQEHGGILLIDSVDMERSAPEPMQVDPKKAKRQLDDLKNFYTQLWITYCEKFQELLGIPRANLRHMPRFPILDNTTGKGFYFREVITPEFLRYLIKKYKIPLRLTSAKMERPRIPPEKARELGRLWMEQNGLLERYKKIINERIDAGVVNPEALLTKAGATPLPTDREAIVEALLNVVATAMVQDYPNSYFTLERIHESDIEEAPAAPVAPPIATAA